MYVVLIIVAIVVVYYMGQQGFFKGKFSFTSPSTTPYAPLDNNKEFLTYNVNLNLNPTNICVGGSTTGSITSNIPNGVCSIYANSGSGFNLLRNVNLNSAGSFSAIETMNTVGTAIFRTICCDNSGNCRVSNDVNIIVRVCDNDGDGVPDDVDNDDDNDGYPDVEEIQEGTDPLDPNSHPTENGGVVYTCGQNGDIETCSGTCPSDYPMCTQIFFDSENAYACSCINDNTQMVHPDWKPDGIYHNPVPSEEQDSGSTFCFDNDFHLGFPAKLEVKSSCQDSFGTYYDYCSGDLVHDWFCDGNDCSDALAQSCTSYVSGSSCVDGACLVPPDYYDMSGVKYEVHWDTLLGGRPIRYNLGRFSTWNFESGGGGSGYDLPYTNLELIVFSGGVSPTTVTIPINGHMSLNLDDFMINQDGRNIVLRLNSVASNGGIYYTVLSGTVDMS